ncbi:GGDEF domain-containing protein [Petrocella sp. FN5]|uniref:GGDEF domain-containing protein n=1 Tax=Petrocella sp. FN5 TaxID=3032002 RepID=UPI0023DC7A0A|nr:diguanylate cyclase [Petrocella sp. FN5]MDF1615946.1 diguanylate cyclase [Petrocella sp. FN5]
MSDLQNSVELLIKSHIDVLTNNQKEKNSNHISHQDFTLIEELYEHDEKGIVLINHFGHIEYRNKKFSKLFMLDKYEKAFSNLLNLSQLPLDIKYENKIFLLTYPSGLIAKLILNHQIVKFQKSSLLLLKFTDQTERIKNETDNQSFRTKVAVYFKHIETPMFLVNQDGYIVDVPQNNLKLFGQPLRTIYDESIFEAFPYDYAKEIMERVLHTGEKIKLYFQYQHDLGQSIQVLDTTLHKVGDGLTLCHIKDVSDLNTMSSTLEYLNNFDPLTGFHNHNQFELKLKELDQHGYLPLGVYVLTVQGLKQLNKKLGHTNSDQLLMEIAQDLKSAASQYEIPCRISGDTFILFFPNCSTGTLNRFVDKMDQSILSYNEKYRKHLLTYTQKNMIIKTKQNSLSKTIKGLLP